MQVRNATRADLGGITEIYNHAVKNSVATLDIKPKTIEEQRAWLHSHDAKHPVFVGIDQGSVVGWASLSPYSPRSGYAATAEMSVYVEADKRRLGIGTLLVATVVEHGRKTAIHTILSRIAGENQASILLHEKFGFQHVGTMKEVGYKFGQYVDVHLYQLLYE